MEKKLYIAINRKEKSYLFQIFADPESSRKGFGDLFVNEQVFYVLNKAVKLYNYSIDLGESISSKAVVIEAFDTSAETKSIKDLEPLVKSVYSALRTYKYRLGKIKLTSTDVVENLTSK